MQEPTANLIITDNHLTGDQNHGTTPWPDEYLNSPEKILKEIKRSQELVKQQTALQLELKAELNQLFTNGKIEKKIEHDGITASLCERTTYTYSDELRDQMEREKNLKIAKKKVTSHWRII